MKYLVEAYRIVSSSLRKLQGALPCRASCRVQNFFTFCIGSSVRFSFDPSTKLFCASEAGMKRYFGEMTRGFSIYERGLLRRGKSLHNSYCLQNISFDKSDIVIDCGANYGDIFIPLSSHIDQENYITFEPGPDEYRCLMMSVPNARNNNVGLSNSAGSMRFYLCSATGDSSLVEPAEYTSVIDVEVTTLDKFAKENDITRCKLLKLEAEGWEPEILDGATEFLKNCEYVAIDGGPERGVRAEATFPDLNNRLSEMGFHMVELRGSRYRALYQRNVEPS